MTSEYVTCPQDIREHPNTLVYPAGTLLRVTERRADGVRVSGHVNNERRKRWLHKSLICELPTAPEGEFWELIFPHAPAQQARILSAGGARGKLMIDGQRADILRTWIESHPAHAITPEGMSVQEQGYILILQYVDMTPQKDIRWYTFTFILGLSETRHG